MSKAKCRHMNMWMNVDKCHMSLRLNKSIHCELLCRLLPLVRLLTVVSAILEVGLAALQYFLVVVSEETRRRRCVRMASDGPNRRDAWPRDLQGRLMQLMLEVMRMFAAAVGTRMRTGSAKGELA